jgi:hypothetical protein
MSKTVTRQEILHHLNPLRGKQLIVGVDAGKNTGVAVWDDTVGEWTLMTVGFWDAHDCILSLSPVTAAIVIEVPSGHVIHKRKEGATKGFGRDRMAANVGSARREATLLAERFLAKGYTVIQEKPTATKWTRAELARHTGIERPTNEHVRDAVRLVYNKGFGVVRP